MEHIKPVLRLFNTATRKIEEVHPLQGKRIRMYTCGPTVYNFAHIGNLRTYVFEDLLRRTLKFFGFEVEQVMNLTDIDDKTIRGAIEKKQTLDAYTQPFIKAFFEDLQTLNIQKVEHYPRATEFVSEMIDIILKLLEKGHAYVGKDGSVYFSIHSFPGYGKLSHLKLGELKEGASERERIVQDEYDKENASDFVLWKSYDPVRDGNVYWDSPFGKGRPGWHIECSAMAMKLLGRTIDIHCGGVDNMFPHHENEIAQSECCSGQTFVNHWVHVEHLIVDHKKMSKSLGNFFTLRDLLKKGFDPLEVRYLLLQGHYRMQLNFTFQELEAVRASLTRLQDFIFRLREISSTSHHGHVTPILIKTKERFAAALADDINIALAFSALFELVREINILCDKKEIGKEEAEKTLHLLGELDAVLACLPLKPKELPVPAEVSEALEKREIARKEKNWKMADELRDFIHAKGYMIDDTPGGLRLKKRQ